MSFNLNAGEFNPEAFLQSLRKPTAAEHPISFEQYIKIKGLWDLYGEDVDSEYNPDIKQLRSQYERDMKTPTSDEPGDYPISFEMYVRIKGLWRIHGPYINNTNDMSIRELRSEYERDMKKIAPLRTKAEPVFLQNASKIWEKRDDDEDPETRRLNLISEFGY